MWNKVIAGFLAMVAGHAFALTAGVQKAGLPGENAALIDAVAGQLKGAGYEVLFLDADGLCDAAKLNPKTLDLLVLSNAAGLPAGSVAPIGQFIKGGGDLIALNAPLWQTLLIKPGSKWVSWSDYEKETAGVLPEHVLFSFKPEDIAGWKRACNTADGPATYDTVSGGPAAGQRAFHAKLTNLQNWDNYGPEKLEHPFPEGHTLTVFSAKGAPGTAALAVEWQEKDGSRWIATVPLSEQWRRYVLSPEDFKYWESVPGRRADHFHPENAVRMNIGLAFTHTGATPGPHEYWVGPFGTAKVTPELAKILVHPAIPAMDLFSPGYKFFESHEVAQVKSAAGQSLIAEASFGAPKDVKSIQPRPGGGGFNKGRDWRWIPLMEAETGSGEWRGNPGALMAQVGGAFKGGQWASFGVADSQWYLSPKVLKAIGRIARKMGEGLYLVDGGSDFYTYFENQAMMLGLRVANLGHAAQKGLKGRVTVTDVETGKEITKQEWPLDLAAGQEQTVSEAYKLHHWPRKGVKVTAQLLKNGAVVDQVSHEAHVWRPKTRRAFVTAKDGHFMLNDARWQAHGVNYMPSSGIGTEDGLFFEQWLGARSYDPEIIERDLGHIQAMGLNAVSIFLNYDNMKSQNLLDLLLRLEVRGMKANLSLRPGTGFDFKWPLIREMIGYYRLAENDTVFAYDIDWEPLFMKHDDRKRWDADWAAWIAERYGSIENAEKDWGFPVPRDAAGKVTNPDRKQMESDGAWGRMVAAYRRCMDTILYKYYSADRALIRTIDPNHFVSFRMSEAGDPTMRWDDVMPYDFPYLAAAVDILEPEGYGRIGNWEKVKPGWFEFEYARWAAPDTPMMWAEAGMSAWDVSRGEASPAMLDTQAQYYRDFYRMMISSGAKGIFWWWYPGGFRVGENSDFGIINCDGSDRANTKVIRDNAKSFLASKVPKPVDTWITIDRDARADGVSGIYDTVKAAFWKAIDAGKTPGLKTSCTGTDSGNCPLLAVGDTQCNGTNPPKYLDGYFDSVEIQDASGQWVKVENGGTVKVAPSKMVVARVLVTNLGEAKWLREGPGAVVVTVANGGKAILPNPVAHLDSAQVSGVVVADSGVTGRTEATLSFRAEGRTPFGEKFKIALEI